MAETLKLGAEHVIPRSVSYAFRGWGSIQLPTLKTETMPTVPGAASLGCTQHPVPNPQGEQPQLDALHVRPVGAKRLVCCSRDRPETATFKYLGCLYR